MKSRTYHAYFKSATDDSLLFAIMSITRQSEHIFSRSRLPEKAPCMESLPNMFSIIFAVPNGLWQLMQRYGSASYKTCGSFTASFNNKRGSRVIAFSGQVFSHSPHWTQFF